jgi:hypothetical protein
MLQRNMIMENTLEIMKMIKEKEMVYFIIMMEINMKENM